MIKNMNTTDRGLRALLIAPLAVVIGVLVGPGSVGSIVLYAVAAVMLATGAAGYCPLYSVLRWAPAADHHSRIEPSDHRNET